MAVTLFPWDDEQVVNAGPVTCLGIEFENDEKRREYYRNELRKKLPELRLIEGFPIGTDEDIIALSDPPYYTACPNPWIEQIVTEWESKKEKLLQTGKRLYDKDVSEPYTNDVSEGKYDPLYLYHSYLTKVPHKAIISYLEHYTQPGDIILDGFAGTGMTGAAARLCDTGARNAICVDLSPLASFIDYTVNSDVSAAEFEKKASVIIKRAESECSWVYETTHTRNGKKGIINYVIWSEVFSCPECSNEVIFWRDAINQKTGKVKDGFNCPHCGASLNKKKVQKLFETTFDTSLKESVRGNKRVPVLINYSYEGRRFEKEPDADDLELIKKIDEFNIPYWVPTDAVPKGDKTGEALQKGVEHFHQFYFKRTLFIFCKIRDEIKDPILNFIITKLAFQSTILYRYIAAGGGPMSGTLYIPSLIKELNVFNQIKSLLSLRYRIDVAGKESSNVVISTQSATDINLVPDNSIDYIFTDPPFGSNLMYSELNGLSEVWLKVKTNNTAECIVNSTQKKTLFEYEGLMQSAFSHYYRILKPGKWISIEFSNTSASVWNSIQVAIQRAGFIVANVSALDKQKESYNATNSTTAVKQDLIISCFKPTGNLIEKFRTTTDTEQNIWDFVEELLEHLPVHLKRDDATAAILERSPKILFDRLVAYYVQHGYQVPIDAADFQKGLKERFVERDGMYFTAEQAIEYEEKKRETTSFVSLALLVGSEAEGIEWLKRKLEDGPKTYSDILPDWMQDLVQPRKGDTLPELMQILDENFLKDENGYWHVPDLNDQAQLDAVKKKRLLKEFDVYVEAKKVKNARLEALKAGFRDCYDRKDFATIIAVGNKIEEELLTTDEVLLRFYDIASSRV